MNWSWQQIGEFIFAALAITAICWCVVLLFLRVHEKKALLIRVGISAPLTIFVYIEVLPLFASLGYGMIAGLFYMWAYGLVMGMIWVPSMTGFVGGLFGSLYDGGSMEVEPAPFYSIFKAKRTKGKYFEALAEVRKQLEKFPNDFEGHMLLAELQAENLDDLPGAALTIQRACALPEQTQQNVAYAMNKLSDWQLSVTKDRDAARETLEKLAALLPDTEIAARAAQRIAHLANNEMLLASNDRRVIEVKKGIENLGLVRGTDGRLRVPEVDIEKQAAEYMARLEAHPLDTHTREELAVLLAKHYKQLGQALEQLEYLVQQPAHSARQVAHWLNIMADLQVRGGAGEEQARATLQRIIDLFPESGAAEIAQRRMDRLKLEFKGQDKNRDVQMGVYEQNLGLKRR